MAHGNSRTSLHDQRHALSPASAPTELLPLRQLHEKCEHGTASPQERLAWLDHLLAAAQARGDEEAIPFLFRLREAQAAVVATTTEPTLPDPADGRQYLAWLSAAELHVSPLYGQEPVDEETRDALVESIRQEGGLHDPLLVTSEHEILHGRTRWLAWQAAIADPERRLPVLVKSLSMGQKQRAFLSTKVIGQRAAVLRATAAGRRYAVALVETPDSLSDNPPALPLLSSVSPAPREALPTLLAHITTLPEAERRRLTRQLVSQDVALQETLLAEAEQRAHNDDEKRQLRAELQRLHRTLTEVSSDREQHQLTIDQLEEQLAAARLQQAELDALVEHVQRTKQELERGRNTSEAELQAMRTRIAHLAPLERLASAVQASTLLPPALDLAVLTAKRLLPAVVRYVQDADTAGSAKEVGRMLDEVERLVQTCRHRLSAPPLLDRPFIDYTRVQEETP